MKRIGSLLSGVVTLISAAKLKAKDLVANSNSITTQSALLKVPISLHRVTKTSN